MATEYYLALATDISTRDAISALGGVEVECEDTPRGPRCMSALEYLQIAAWIPSDATRDAGMRDYSILATLWISMRIDSQQPEEGHRTLVVAVGRIVAKLYCDLVLYRDEDVLLSRTGGICRVSRTLFWDTADETALGLKDCQIVD